MKHNGDLLFGLMTAMAAAEAMDEAFVSFGEKRSWESPFSFADKINELFDVAMDDFAANIKENAKKRSGDQTVANKPSSEKHPRPERPSREELFAQLENLVRSKKEQKLRDIYAHLRKNGFRPHRDDMPEPASKTEISLINENARLREENAKLKARLYDLLDKTGKL